MTKDLISRAMNELNPDAKTSCFEVTKDLISRTTNELNTDPKTSWFEVSVSRSYCKPIRIFKSRLISSCDKARFLKIIVAFKIKEISFSRRFVDLTQIAQVA